MIGRTSSSSRANATTPGLVPRSSNHFARLGHVRLQVFSSKMRSDITIRADQGEAGRQPP